MDDKITTSAPLGFEAGDKIKFSKGRPERRPQDRRWHGKLAELLQADAMAVRDSEADHQGYNTPADAKRAARRAARAVAKAALEGGQRPATHLQRKVALLVPLKKRPPKPIIKL